MINVVLLKIQLKELFLYILKEKNNKNYSSFSHSAATIASNLSP